MLAATRPVATAAAALMGATVIAAVPVLTPATPAVPRFHAPDVALTSSIFDILTFPAWQQAIANEVEFVAIRTAGLAEAGTGLVESLAQLPATLLTAAQQVFSGDALDALTTVETWAVDAATATLVPPVAANIEVGQIQLAIQSALLVAQPVAAVELGASLFTAFDTVSRSFIVAGQDVLDAVLSFDIGGVIEAIISGVSGVVTAFGAGAQAVIDGVVSAQTTLAAALATRPILIPPIGPSGVVPKIAATESVTTAVTDSATSEPVTVERPSATVEAATTAEPAAATVRSGVRSTPRGGEGVPRTTPSERTSTAAETTGATPSKADSPTKADSRRTTGR